MDQSTPSDTPENTQQITPAPTPIQILPEPQNPKFFKTKKGIGIIVGIILLLLIILGIVWFAMLSKSKQPTLTTTRNNQQTEKSQDVKTYPKFEFTYSPPAEIPGSPPNLFEYEIKSSFSDNDTASLGAYFGFNSADGKKDKETTIFKSKTGYMVLNNETGEFVYQNAGSPLSLAETDAETGTLSFLSKIGLQDGTVQCNITYQNKKTPDMTYVECHRSWEALSAPLLNLPGLLNIPENTSFNSLRLGYNSFPLQNTDIVNVSTGQNGIERPNDFNTATFAISSNNTIVSLTSNLRFITGKSEIPVISPTEAINLFSEHKAEATLALPSGSGNFAWESVFPKGKTATGNASIDSIEIAYVDNGSSQKQTTYTPFYIIRGGVELNSGYRVNYVQKLSAVNTNSSQISEENAKNNLQLKTFNLPTRSATAVITPTTPRRFNTLTPAPTITPRPPFTCDESNIVVPDFPGSEYSSYPITLPSGEIITVIHAVWSPTVNTFWLKQSNLTLEKLQKIRAEFRDLALNGYLKEVPYAAYFSAGFQNDHECYLTGASPSIFIYSDTKTQFVVTPYAPTYSDPYLLNKNWNAVANSNGILSVNNLSRNYLYYEFNPKKVVLEKQEKGFVLSVEDIKPFAPKLAKEMNLNSKESERLLFELELAAKDLPKDTEYIKISLVPSTELDKKLPLAVSPKPEHTNRYHFLLSRVDKNTKTTRPVIPPIKRGTSTLVEIGASAQ